MSQPLFLHLLSKKISGEATLEELEELERLLKLHPDWAYQAEQIQSLWQQTIPDDEQESEQAFEQHLKRMKDSGIDFPESKTSQTIVPVRHYNKRKIVALSLTAVIFFIATFVWIHNSNKIPVLIQEKKYSEVSSPPGSKTKLVLPDSTVVWLNAGSKLTYNEHFGTTNRNTTLTGEAFFDVKKSSIPFIIHANTVQIKVLGTAFNVKAYPNEKTTETSLIRGRVEITLDKRPGQPFILKPNEKLIVANDQDEIKPEVKKKEPLVVWKGLTRTKDSSIVETSWVENKLVFQDESFTEIAQKMERWYGVSIEFRNEEVAAERLSGTFTTETIREALTALQITTRFHYTMKGNSIIITQ